jgi:hypothetical protein
MYSARADSNPKLGTVGPAQRPMRPSQPMPAGALSTHRWGGHCTSAAGSRCGLHPQHWGHVGDRQGKKEGVGSHPSGGATWRQRRSGGVRVFVDGERWMLADDDFSRYLNTVAEARIKTKNAGQRVELTIEVAAAAMSRPNLAMQAVESDDAGNGIRLWQAAHAVGRAVSGGTAGARLGIQ